MSLYEMPQIDSNGLNLIDLFCGAGIGAYGFKRAGFNMCWGVDCDDTAVLTYNTNIGNHAICQDIRTINREDIPVDNIDVMVATPVCKPFSVCGARRLTNDERYGDLLAETIRLFEVCRPKALFFENVAGIAMAESLSIFEQFVRDLESFGYHSYWSITNSWDLGVPQERNRVYMVLIRDDIPYEFIPPKKLIFGKTTQRDAFYDLKDKPDNYVKNHIVSSFPYKRYESFSVNSRQTGWDEPSKTVLSHRDSVLLYPEPTYVKGEVVPRKMSVREHLRLQTVGDDFYFPDEVSLLHQYDRCSGVPSLVSYKYGLAIADCLLGKTKLRQNTVKKRKLF